MFFKYIPKLLENVMFFCRCEARSAEAIQWLFYIKAARLLRRCAARNDGMCVLKFIGYILTLTLSLNLYATTLTIAVTSSFSSTFTKLAPVFEKKTGIKLNTSFASSGQLATHIIHGAPIDVFLSADQNHITQLEKAGLAAPSDKITYAYGKLGMVIAGNIPKSINKIAVANPAFAPYGVATIQVLERTGLMAALKSKIVWGESVGQVASFIQSGNVKAGFIAQSQWYLLKKQTPGLSFWVVPHNLYDPIEHSATRILSSKNPKEAKLFLSFLKTKSARRIIRANGYILQIHDKSAHKHSALLN